MTKTQIQDKFKDLPIDRIKLYISALTELLYSKLIEEKYPICKKEDCKQITIEEALEGMK